MAWPDAPSATALPAGSYTWLEKGFCWIKLCHAFYLFNGVGKSNICDEAIREASARARDKVARVSESTASLLALALAALAVEVARGSECTVEPGTVADTEVLELEAMRRNTKFSRMITRGISASGGTTPRSAIITAIRQQYKLRKRWRANRTRQPNESEEGEGAFSLAKIREMAAEGRCLFSIEIGSCRLWFPRDRWELPDEVDYADLPAIDFMRFIAGIVDAIEMAGRWEVFKIENVPGQPLGRGSEYRKSVVALACVLLWGTPDPSWKNVQDIIQDLDPAVVPCKALQHRSAQYVERLEGLRAEARELLRASGDQFLDEAFRGGSSGIRSVSVVMKERERKVRAQYRGPAEASAVVASSLRPAPYATPPPPPARVTAQAPWQRSRPPAAHIVQAKTEVVIQQIDTSFHGSKARPGTVSQAVAMAVAMTLASVPKAQGAEILEQSCVAQSIVVGVEVGLYWLLVLSLLISWLLVMFVFAWS